MLELAEGRINDRWSLQLTPDRVEFHAKRPLWEAGRLESCAELMRPGMIVYDVGAESGDFTSLYRQWVGPDGDVVPVEPQPAYWPSIRRTWEANGFAPPRAWFPGFAGDATSIERLKVYLGDMGWPHESWPPCSLGPVVPDFGFRHLAQQFEDTPSIRLDELATLTGTAPDAIVMDIEGAEWNALVGCTGLFVEARPLLWVSVHEPTMLEWYDKTLDDLLQLMADHGYRYEQLPHHGEGETFWLFTP